MAAPPQFARGDLSYPTTDGKPMAETDQHRNLMNDLIGTLKAFFAADPLVYVSGNLIVCYVPGDRRRHVSPDVFVVRGVEKGDRLNYITWDEGHNPQVVIELTSSSTADEDTGRKFALYRDVLRVPEYFLFDPLGHYLRPRLQGYRLDDKGQYVPIEPVHGRLPSATLRLHLEAAGQVLRLWDPASGVWLPTPLEARHQAEARAHEAEDRAREAETEWAAEAAARRQAEEAARQATRQAEEARRRAEEQGTLVEQARQRSEDQARQAEEARRRAEEQAALVEQARQRAEQARRAEHAERLRTEEANRLLLEEVERLRRQLGARLDPPEAPPS